jgi:hypothetical protein
LQTGGSALGDTSTKSNPASSAIFSASGEHSMQRFPYLLVIGDREMENKQETNFWKHRVCKIFVFFTD